MLAALMPPAAAASVRSHHQVVQGMEAVDAFYSGYGDIKAFKGNAPEQVRLYKEGIAYTK